MNSLVDIPGEPPAMAGNFVYTLPQPAVEFTFFVRRIAAAAPMMAPFDVIDRCGSWPTFVGAGTDIS
jgi:hypothetical protein